MHLFQVIVDGSGILTHYLTGNSSIEQTQVKDTGSRGFDFYADSLLDGPSHLTVKNCTFQNYTGVSGIINAFVYIRISLLLMLLRYILNIQLLLEVVSPCILQQKLHTTHGNYWIQRYSYIGESSSTGITNYIPGDGPQYTASGRVFILKLWDT